MAPATRVIPWFCHARAFCILRALWSPVCRHVW